MTIEERLEQIEQLNQQISRTNKRLRVALTMTVVVTMAATGEKVSEFDVVVARSIYVTNDAREFVVALGVSEGQRADRAGFGSDRQRRILNNRTTATESDPALQSIANKLDNTNELLNELPRSNACIETLFMVLFGAIWLCSNLA